MNKEKMTGARIVIETLIEQGVTDVFGYPGGQVHYLQYGASGGEAAGCGRAGGVS